MTKNQGGGGLNQKEKAPQWGIQYDEGSKDLYGPYMPLNAHFLGRICYFTILDKEVARGKNKRPRSIQNKP